MVYLYPNGDTFTIYSDISSLPEEYHSEVIEIESLPEGEGVLRQAGDGSFYYEPFPEPTPIEPVEPIEPEQPQPIETTEEKLERVLKQLDVQQKQNLILLDVNMTIYEELLLMQKGLSNA